MWAGTIEHDQRTALGTYLRECRENVPPTTKWLSEHERLSQRVGRRVTQEEVAEAIGASRAWYAMIETGAAERTTPRLLERIAETLGLEREQRVTLLRLAFPELAALLSGDQVAA